MGTRKVVVALSVAIAGGHGSALSQQAVPGAKAEIVRLDAVVTDATGTPIRDLSREDFELRDDGKPQRLTHFAFVGKGGAAEAKATAEPPAKGATAPEEEEAQEAGRTIAIRVDDLHSAPGSLQSVKEALRRGVDEFLLPNDNVALITTGSPGGVQAMTQERASLKQAINALAFNQRAGAPGKDSQMTPEQAELILRGDRNALLLPPRMMVEDPSSLYNTTTATPPGTSAAPQDSARQPGDALTRQALQTEANVPGGSLGRGTNDLAGGLRRMLADNEAYYPLASEPAGQKRDGLSHRIELRLPRRPQLVV